MEFYNKKLHTLIIFIDKEELSIVKQKIDNLKIEIIKQLSLEDIGLDSNEYLLNKEIFLVKLPDNIIEYECDNDESDGSVQIIDFKDENNIFRFRCVYSKFVYLFVLFTRYFISYEDFGFVVLDRIAMKNLDQCLEYYSEEDLNKYILFKGKDSVSCEEWLYKNFPNWKDSEAYYDPIGRLGVEESS